MTGECSLAVCSESGTIVRLVLELIVDGRVSSSYLQYFATKTSPTEHLLTLWDARQDSLVNLINVLNQIGRSDAACVIIAQMNITH